MNNRINIKSILILGAGPIVIGQACEFDYAGVQACRALREEGYRIILINSNPATIMTDPETADIIYIEPIHWKIVKKIIKKERPDAILPTMGGQTALNCVLELHHNHVLDKYNVKMIGATIKTIEKAENRQLFDKAMKKIGLETAKSGVAHSFKEALLVLEKIGFPCIIRPSFTMGGTGGGIAYNLKDFKKICDNGLLLSPIKELIIDESLIGWKEYEMEVMRDKKDNCIIVCSIENLDPMGIHTGDSITVAPAQTLTDKEYQIMRNAAISVLREIEVETGGSNVQFAVNPKNGKLIIIEMNPRVSRSSALASKATGFPIAKIAAKLAVGYTLDELKNEITGNQTPASFEPTIDYVVTKVPRFNFEKFIGTNNRLTTQMKSVGEVMAIGRTFQESIQKALCSLEIGISGFDQKVFHYDAKDIKKIKYELKNPGSDRILYVADAFRAKIIIETIFKLTNIDYWFLTQIKELIDIEEQIKSKKLKIFNLKTLKFLKKKGFSDARIAFLKNTTEKDIRELRYKLNVRPVYKRIDTCSAEFSTNTAYMYSTYEEECESNPNKNSNKILILGGGPNRIGQGVEFDYCCVHAALALKKDNFETIIINCNPETVSTDYDISDRLYFEPVTLENVLEIVHLEKPKGVIIQYGGQTPLNLAKSLELENVTIIGTNPKSIDCAEDRQKFQKIIYEIGLKQPKNAIANNIKEAIEKTKIIGYPLVIRPSYVLGGRAMQIIYNEIDLQKYFKEMMFSIKDYPILLDQFLDNATEVDVDAICDGKQVLIAGIMEHIEQAGVHSGDSACCLPPYTLNKNIQNKLRKQVEKLAFKLNISGLMNVQFAIKKDVPYLIEVNPRAARTIPFVSKAIGIPLAKIAARVMIGKSLKEQGILKEILPPYFSIKEVVLPFNKFKGVDPILSPEMRSTGEVMSIGITFEEAFSKSMLATQSFFQKRGRVLLCLGKKEKNKIINLAKKLINLGFQLDATPETGKILKYENINVRILNSKNTDKLNIFNCIKNREYVYIVNIEKKINAFENSKNIRIHALQNQIHFDTTIKGSFATISALNSNPIKNVLSINEIHAKLER
ncbi:carbamoyl-phosphate synthase large subunit [Candidatus Tachikawaea gelatinosa]|uniref:Carbamoyl phosphate synthase large chain n=1 Tax=Candidatus Tachikawaea gelatinosa TaxID=1410383 RepID=A0A090BWL2_9ENTR|nr:carbamoyl-phosphate synthase large subunit [Candidatus Tachikawaea gelatinosa]BAP58801.1 carbamoyl-phosphate synthase large chain [Candidatus Tachikawaea gelatinosa]